jgi:hypothetical protein
VIGDEKVWPLEEYSQSILRACKTQHNVMLRNSEVTTAFEDSGFEIFKHWLRNDGSHSPLADESR